MITLQFTQANDLASRAIQLFERGWPTHVDVVLPQGGLLGARHDVVADTQPGVQIRPANYAKWDRVERITLDIGGPEHEAAFYIFLRSQIGKPYDMAAIAAFPLRRNWRDPNSWFCSELVAAALQACGFFPTPLAIPANEITPRDLYMVVSSLPSRAA